MDALKKLIPTYNTQQQQQDSKSIANSLGSAHVGMFKPRQICVHVPLPDDQLDAGKKARGKYKPLQIYAPNRYVNDIHLYTIGLLY